MKSIADDLLKYWPILSAIAIGMFLGVGWCIRLEVKANSAELTTKANDIAIDDLTHRIIQLETKEELREAGLCK